MLFYRKLETNLVQEAIKDKESSPNHILWCRNVSLIINLSWNLIKVVDHLQNSLSRYSSMKQIHRTCGHDQRASQSLRSISMWRQIASFDSPQPAVFRHASEPFSLGHDDLSIYQSPTDSGRFCFCTPEWNGLWCWVWRWEPIAPHSNLLQSLDARYTINLQSSICAPGKFEFKFIPESRLRARKGKMPNRLGFERRKQQQSHNNLSHDIVWWEWQNMIHSTPSQSSAGARCGWRRLQKRFSSTEGMLFVTAGLRLAEKKQSWLIFSSPFRRRSPCWIPFLENRRFIACK